MSDPPASEPEKPHLDESRVTLQEGLTSGLHRGPHPSPSNGGDIAAAEAEGLMENWLGTAYVRASPEEVRELCLPRSGAAAPTGDRRDDDDALACRTTKLSPN